MTEPTSATMLSFASPDGQQLETVRVALSGLALRATGYIVSAGAHAYGASYSIAVDAQGRSKRISVRCDDAVGERSVSLTRSPGGPWISESSTGSTPHPELGDAVDIYLVGSAFSASLPVRRLGLHTEVGKSAEVMVASVSLPDLSVTPVTHRGTNAAITPDGASITYSGSYGDREVVVDSDGLFVRTDGLRHRIS